MDKSTMVPIIGYENEVFRAYAFWSSILVIKILSMAFLTGIQRFKTKTFANPEDTASKKIKVKFDDPDVERVRRAHRNDLENILPFFVVGYMYILTNPNPTVAINLFRAVAIARIVHTFVYAVVVIPQPARALAFFVALGCTVYMAVQSIIFFI